MGNGRIGMNGYGGHRDYSSEPKRTDLNPSIGWNSGSHGYNKSGYYTPPKPAKKIAHAKVTIYKGDLSDDSGTSWEIVKEFYVTDKQLSDAINAASEVLEVYKDVISSDDTDLYSMPAGANNIPNLFMKEGTIPTKRTWTRNVATCAYNATDNYIQHWLGRKLDRNDADWYARHSLVTTDGLPQEYSFTVLQQLVAPYGCGIKSIQVPKNTRRFEEHKMFIKALGANPFFTVNGFTTNEEAYQTLYPESLWIALGLDTPAKRNEHKKGIFSKWNFECVDEPDQGAVIMKQFGLAQTGHNGGANYYGPRAAKSGTNENWLMAIKFDELSKIQYLDDMQIPEYTEYEGTTQYDWLAIRCFDKKQLREYIPKPKYGAPSSGAHYQSQLYDENTAGSGTNKTEFFSNYLIGAGFTNKQIEIMSWKTARELREKNLLPEDVVLASNGRWVPLAKGQVTALTTTTPITTLTKAPTVATSLNDKMVLAYPPTCEGCQLPPGELAFDIVNNLLCQHCGRVVETSEVPTSYLLDGWTAADTIEQSGLNSASTKDTAYSDSFNAPEEDGINPLDWYNYMYDL